MAEIASVGKELLAALISAFGPAGAVLAAACGYLVWRLRQAEARVEALSDRLIALGDRSTEKLSSLAGERMNADLALAKALEELTDKVEGLPRGRGR